MSLLPFAFDNTLRDLNRLHRSSSLFDQHFGLGVLDDDIINPNWVSRAFTPRYVSPWAQTALQPCFSDVINSKDSFKVNVDVQQFKPEEITVKTAGDYVVVEGKHEERKDEHGLISRQFQRRYWIPDDVDRQSIVSKLSSDGILSVEANKKTEGLSDADRVIPITCTKAPAALSQPPKEEQSNGKTDK